VKIVDRCAALPVASRRLLAVVVVPLLLVALCMAISTLLQQVAAAQRQWRTEAKQLLSEAASAPAMQSAIEQQLDAVRSSPLRSKFYPVGGAMTAESSLQADVDALVSSVQATSRIIAPLPASETPPLLRYGVRLNASLRINQLQNLLNGLARHSRLLRVEHLIVVAPQMQVVDENPPLAVTLDIYGYGLATDAPVAINAAAARGARR